jgi:hypothetical protein
MKKSVWMSYDLGVKGDYESLYYWLDSRQAKECGDGLAYFTIEEKKDVTAEIAISLKNSMKIDARTRIYLIYKRTPKSEAEKGNVRGVFLFGRRKPAPWAGFASGETADEESRGDQS